MQARSGDVIPVAEFMGRENVATRVSAENVLSWMSRLVGGIVIAVVAAIVLPALMMAGLCLILSDLPRSPAHVAGRFRVRQRRRADGSGISCAPVLAR
jgi:hypothetical protein